MPSDKRRKKSRPVSTGPTGESIPSDSTGEKDVSAPQLSGFSDENLTDETIYQSSRISPPAVDSRSTNLVGVQLDDFKILRKLGQGGMATVYLAEQVSLKREAAIKVMHNELMSDETHVRRFEREAKAAAGLTHPNIVQVYMTGDYEGTHYIAQEYVRGINLRQYLARNAPPDGALILRIMRQVTAALNAAAEKGIVHRDIKPENIMITSRKLIKVADFGLAQIAQTEERVDLTQVGTTMGTPLYMSPEQVHGKSLDQRSDIYSLGVTCYHLIAGRPPFQGETALSIAVKHLNESAPSLAKRRPDLPVELCELVHRMMEKDPNKRPANAAELMQEIKKIPEQSSGRAGKKWAALIPFQGNRGYQKQLLAFVVAFVCLGGVAAAIGWVNRPGDPLNAPFQEQSEQEQAESLIPREKTPLAQFLLATRLKDKEEAWQAVIDYEPAVDVYKKRAQIRLGVLLIRPDRYDEAKAIFQGLANSGQPEYEVNGYAGLMALESINGNAREAQDIWEIRVQNRTNNLDAGLIEYVVMALEENQNALDVDNGEEIRRLSSQIDEDVGTPGRPE